MKTAPGTPPQRQPGIIPEDAELVALLAGAFTTGGKPLLPLLDEKPMMLFFLRHFGCAFCRETIHDVAKARTQLDARGVRPVFVHMATPQRAQAFFNRYGLPTVDHVSDPEMKLYSAPVFHLLKSTVLPHFFGANAYWKLAKRALWRYGAGSPVKEDPTQLPGIFFLKDRAIHRAFRHKNLGDRIDYSLFGV